MPIWNFSAHEQAEVQRNKAHESSVLEHLINCYINCICHGSLLYVLFQSFSGKNNFDIHIA